MRSPAGRVTKHTRLSADGRSLLLDWNGYWYDFDPSDSQVVELLLDGTQLRLYDTPGLHHPFLELQAPFRFARHAEHDSGRHHAQ